MTSEKHVHNLCQRWRGGCERVRRGTGTVCSTSLLYRSPVCSVLLHQLIPV